MPVTYVIIVDSPLPGTARARDGRELATPAGSDRDRNTMLRQLLVSDPDKSKALPRWQDLALDWDQKQRVLLDSIPEMAEGPS